MHELSGRRTGGDVLVEILSRAGVDTVFGVVSIHNVPLVDAVARNLRFVPVRHEAAAVNAADGYARAGRPFGVAITSTGTGAGNAAGSLVEALSAGSAVLHITGQVDVPYLGAGRGYIHETRDQIGMLRAVSKRAETVLDASSAADLLWDAIRSLMTLPRGPVSIEWPADLQYDDGGVHDVGDPRPPSLPLIPDAGAVERAAALIAASRRPLIWAGGGAVGATTQVSELLDRIGAGLLTSNAGRGTVPEHDRRVVGNFASNPACAPLLAESDLLISIGSHFRSNETRSFQLALPRPHVQVDVDPAAIGRSYACDVGLVGEAAHTIDVLLSLLPRTTSVDPGWAARVTDTRDAVRNELRAGIGPQAELCDILRAELPADAVLARDVTIPSSTWGNRLFDVYDPATNIFARGGGIGQGLAMGIGAAMAQPGRPTVVLVGDGGLVVHLGELATLAEQRLDVVVMVFNDHGYGVLRNLQDHHLGRRSGVDLFTPDFSLVAAAVGLPYRPVKDASGLRAALVAALGDGGPSLIEVDVDAVGPMPRPFVPPVHVGVGP
jgi:acetolactate synthase-1/2/3 large subunit